MTDKEKTRASKFLSLILRHEPERVGIELDSAGWVEVDTLLRALNHHGVPLTRAQLEHIVATSEKKRFALSEDGKRVRANQGHSIEVDLQYAPATPPEFLYHGTADRFVQSIRAQGLQRMERHHVHLSAETSVTMQVGARRGRPLLLVIRAGDMHRAGHVFYRSANNVWLVDEVPPEFILFPDGGLRALIMVDIQNDFIPGGALAVAGGDTIIPVVNELQDKFPIVVATQDWHPPNHGSFAANHPGRQVYQQIDLNGLPQTLWPVHCVQKTVGAELAPTLRRDRIAQVFTKGTDPGIDSYSGFFDNGHRRATGMGEWLKQRGVTEVFVCGLATDYCVKFTALGAIQLGFKTHLIEEASRGVDVQPGDVARAIEEMRSAGVVISDSQTVQGLNGQP